MWKTYAWKCAPVSIVSCGRMWQCVLFIFRLWGWAHQLLWKLRKGLFSLHCRYHPIFENWTSLVFCTDFVFFAKLMHWINFWLRTFILFFFHDIEGSRYAIHFGVKIEYSMSLHCVQWYEIYIKTKMYMTACICATMDKLCNMFEYMQCLVMHMRDLLTASLPNELNKFKLNW